MALLYPFLKIEINFASFTTIVTSQSRVESSSQVEMQ